MAAQPYNSNVPTEAAAERESLHPQQPRVAGRYDGGGNFGTPVVGRVAGRYDGFDAISAVTGGGKPAATSPGAAFAPAESRGSSGVAPSNARFPAASAAPTSYPNSAAPPSNAGYSAVSAAPTSYSNSAAPPSNADYSAAPAAPTFYGNSAAPPSNARFAAASAAPTSYSNSAAPPSNAGYSAAPTSYGNSAAPPSNARYAAAPSAPTYYGNSAAPAANARYAASPAAPRDVAAAAPAAPTPNANSSASTLRARSAAPAAKARSAASRAASRAEDKGNRMNYRVANQVARRKEDDTSAGQGSMLGVTGLLRNPRNRLYLATLVASTPFLISFSFYVSQFSFQGQLTIGILCGLCIQGVYFLYTLHRTHQRKSKTVQIAQMATLDANQLKTILPTMESFPRWISFTDFEEMNWLNKTMTKLWPYIDQAASGLIKEKVQPILDQYAMGIIQKLELKEVAFGNKAPQVTGVRLSAGLEDETVLEIKILWETSKEGVVLSVDFPGPNYKVQLKNWHLKGTAKLIFKPLTGTIPGFGAVLVSLTEPPDFDFDLKFLGGDVGALPGVEKMIDNSIRTALMDSLVWPSRIVVPMIPGGDFSFLELHPVGELEVKVIEGKNIKNTDLIGKADPFVVLFVRQTKDKVKRTKSKKNTLKPVWNETFNIEVEDPESQRLTFRLMDDESVQKSEYIGTAALAIKEFTPRVRIEHWCDVLEDPESHAPDQIRGSLHVVVTYLPYSREQIAAKRGGPNETERKIYEEQQILGAQEKMTKNTAGDAPKQQGNITQHPAETPRAPGPAANL